MFRPKLLFTSLAALALGACSPQDPQAVTSAAIAKQVILPTYSRWVEADRNWPSAPWPTAKARKPGHRPRRLPHAQKAWAELQPLLIGPLAEGNRSWQVQFWPDKKTWWAARSSNWSLPSRRSTPPHWPSPAWWCKACRPTSTSCSTASRTSPRRAESPYCPLLVAIGERQKQLAEEILKSWNSTDGMLAQMSKFPNQRYADSHEAIADLLRPGHRPGHPEEKLGAPMGRQSKGIRNRSRPMPGAASLR
jgi:predicted lipoprotein